jgi:hypothetical protein
MKIFLKVKRERGGDDMVIKKNLQEARFSRYNKEQTVGTL